MIVIKVPGFPAAGMAVFPFVIINSCAAEQPGLESLLHHEAIHLRQQAEMLVLPFFLWYGIEFLVRLLMIRSFWQAYAAISFEREAFAKMREPSYLESRRFWAFLRYTNRK